MLVVHHLNDSRSQRVLWLLEELELPCEIKHYQRDAITRLALPELKAVHPLGNELSGAGIQMSFVGEADGAGGSRSNYPNLAAWLTRFQARPAYRKALERGGPYPYGS